MNVKATLLTILAAFIALAAAAPPSSSGPGHDDHHDGGHPIDHADPNQSPLLAQNATWETDFPVEGTSYYHCVPHPEMMGKVRISATDPNAKDRVNVTIQNYTFTPAEVVVKPGGIVNWTNLDVDQHNVHLYKFEAAADSHAEHRQTPGIAPFAVLAALGLLALVLRPRA